MSGFLRAPIGSSIFSIQPTISVDSAHPRIFINAANLAEIQARTTGSHTTEFVNVESVADAFSAAQITTYTTTDPLNAVRAGLAAAFVYMADDMPGRADGNFLKAKAVLDGIGNFGGDDKSAYAFESACIIYDWLYNDLTAGERTGYVSAINTFVTGHSFYNQYNTFDPYYNDKKHVCSIFILAATAIYNDDSTSGDEYITRALAVYSRCLLAFNEIAPDGNYYPIGQPQYADESGPRALFRMLGGFKLAGISGTTIDALDDSAASNAVYGYVYNMIKDNYVVSNNDVDNPNDAPWVYFLGPEGPFFLSMLCSLYEGQTSGKLAHYLTNNVVGDKSSLEITFSELGQIIFNDKTANAVGTSITDLPKTKVFDNNALIYRSGWGGLTADGGEIFFNTIYHRQVNGHTHFQRGHFDIWRGYDQLTFVSGKYPTTTSDVHYDYYRDSLAANCVLIYRSDEATGGFPNEGGQMHGDAGSIGNTSGVHDSTSWGSDSHTEVAGSCYMGPGIYQSAFGADWFYSLGQYGEAYWASKVTDVSGIRARIGDYFFIVDRVDGISASYTKRNLLHSNAIPTIEDSGTWDGGTALDGNGATPGQTSSDAQLLSVTQGSSKLFVKYLYPASFTIRRVGGTNYEYYSSVETTNYSSGYDGIGNDGEWRIECEATGGNIDDVFLRVLHATSSAGSPSTITGISGSNYVGATVDDTNFEIGIFSNDVTNGEETGYTFTQASAKTVRLLAGDLQAGTYSVTLDTVEQGPFTVTDGENCLYFTTTGGGDFVINRTGA